MRFHPYLGEILAYGARTTRELYPGLRIRNADFLQSAIPMLAERGLIVKIEPGRKIPQSLKRAAAEHFKRRDKLATWFPSLELGEQWVSIWDRAQPIFYNGRLFWPLERRARRRTG